jgi:hypothetical protein
VVKLAYSILDSEAGWINWTPKSRGNRIETEMEKVRPEIKAGLRNGGINGFTL